MTELDLANAMDQVRILQRQGNTKSAATMQRLINRVRQLQTKAVDPLVGLSLSETHELASSDSKIARKVAFTEGSEGRE